MKQRIITGIRPSNNLTLANILGAVLPMVELQKNTDLDMYAFVATMHGLTDFEAHEIIPFVREVVKDYLALGLDPHKITLFDQRFIRKEVSLLKLYLERFITVARACRVPALKDKLKDNQKPEEATVMLMGYPIMMAADILLQSATCVPVGKDQYSHIELAKELTDSFNSLYGEIFVRPDVYNIKEPINILALYGDGKMSKSKPESAIFLSDNTEVIYAKIKRAETGESGVITPHIENLKTIALSLDPSKKEIIESLIIRHQNGEKVMGLFKESVFEIVSSFTKEIQTKRNLFADEYIDEILREGGEKAKKNAQEILNSCEKAMGIVS